LVFFAQNFKTVNLMRNGIKATDRYIYEGANERQKSAAITEEDEYEFLMNSDKDGPLRSRRSMAAVAAGTANCKRGKLFDNLEMKNITHYHAYKYDRSQVNGNHGPMYNAHAFVKKKKNEMNVICRCYDEDTRKCTEKQGCVYAIWKSYIASVPNPEEGFFFRALIRQKKETVDPYDGCMMTAVKFGEGKAGKMALNEDIKLLYQWFVADMPTKIPTAHGMKIGGAAMSMRALGGDVKTALARTSNAMDHNDTKTTIAYMRNTNVTALKSAGSLAQAERIGLRPEPAPFADRSNRAHVANHSVVSRLQMPSQAPNTGKFLLPVFVFSVRSFFFFQFIVRSSFLPLPGTQFALDASVVMDRVLNSLLAFSDKPTQAPVVTPAATAPPPPPSMGYAPQLLPQDCYQRFEDPLPIAPPSLAISAPTLPQDPPPPPSRSYSAPEASPFDWGGRFKIEVESEDEEHPQGNWEPPHDMQPPPPQDWGDMEPSDYLDAAGLDVFLSAAAVEPAPKRFKANDHADVSNYLDLDGWENQDFISPLVLRVPSPTSSQ
jgi:PHD/YefM family antitoxin component YafN of YafNO toxin-antitoxin module